MIVLGFALVTIALGISLYVNWNLDRKVAILETFIEQSLFAAHQTLETITEIDQAGGFEADDEVGVAFTQIRDAIKDYTTFLGVELVDGKGEEQQ